MSYYYDAAQAQAQAGNNGQRQYTHASASGTHPQYHGHNHASQQQYNTQYATQVAMPNSRSSNHHQSRRHNNQYDHQAHATITESWWECHYCKTTYNIAVNAACVTTGGVPDCYGHPPCGQCYTFTRTVNRNM